MLMANNTTQWCLYLNYRQQYTSKNTCWPLKERICTLKFPIDSAKSNMDTSGKMHTVLSKMKVLQLFFYQLRDQTSVNMFICQLLILGWKIVRFFTNFKMKISNANFFSENNLLWGPLQETINDISISSTILSIRLTKHCIHENVH